MTSSDDTPIEYPDGRLAQFARDSETWATGALDQMDAEGITDPNARAKRLAAEMPPWAVEVCMYEAAYRAAVRILDAKAAAGELIRLGDGAYLTPEGVHRAVEVADRVHHSR